MSNLTLGRIEVTGFCWLWTGYINEDGYGRFSGTQAHRVVYEQLVGPIPEGLELDHLCRVKNCVNPDHLEPVTGAENTRRYHALVTHCKNGHPYDENNTYARPDGFRRCRKCKAEWNARNYRRKQELVNA